jgi:hypothetical protein
MGLGSLNLLYFSSSTGDRLVVNAHLNYELTNPFPRYADTAAHHLQRLTSIET